MNLHLDNISLSNTRFHADKKHSLLATAWSSKHSDNSATREYQNRTIDDKSGFIMYSIMGQNTKVNFWH